MAMTITLLAISIIFLYTGLMFNIQERDTFLYMEGGIVLWSPFSSIPISRVEPIRGALLKSWMAFSQTILHYLASPQKKIANFGNFANLQYEELQQRFRQSVSKYTGSSIVRVHNFHVTCRAAIHIRMNASPVGFLLGTQLWSHRSSCHWANVDISTAVVVTVNVIPRSAIQYQQRCR